MIISGNYGLHFKSNKFTITRYSYIRFIVFVVSSTTLKVHRFHSRNYERGLIKYNCIYGNFAYFFKHTCTLMSVYECMLV